MLVAVVCFMLIAQALGSELPSESVKIDRRTVLVLFGTRHGNRNPEVFLDENPRTWGHEGDTELTSIGKRQAFGLGKELRLFVGSLLSENYNRTQAKYFSSSANRCQMTLQVVLVGLYRPVGWAVWDSNSSLSWSPVPYSINDPMLRMYAVEECKNIDKVWKPIDEDSLPKLSLAKQRGEKLLTYVAEKTGWNMTSLGKLADLADNLIEIDMFNATYPEWILNPTLDGYDKDRLVREIMSFAEIHQIACTNYPPCRDLMAGVWLKHILSTIAETEENKALRVVGYASHTEVTLAVMKLLGIFKDEITTSAGFVLEYRRKPMPSVRLLNHDPDPVDKHVIYKATLVQELADKMDVDGFISLDDFISHVSPKTISDWKTACGVSSDCDTANNSSYSSISPSYCVAMYTLLLLAFIHLDL